MTILYVLLASACWLRCHACRGTTTKAYAMSDGRQIGFECIGKVEQKT